MFDLAGIAPETRPYALNAEDIDKLCSAYLYICEKHPDIKYYEYRASRRVNYSNSLEDVVIDTDEFNFNEIGSIKQ